MGLVPQACRHCVQSARNRTGRISPAKLPGRTVICLLPTKGSEGPTHTAIRKQEIGASARLDEKLEGFPRAARRTEQFGPTILGAEPTGGRDELGQRAKCPCEERRFLLEV